MSDPDGESSVASQRGARIDLAIAVGITVLTQRDVWAQDGVEPTARIVIAALMLLATGSLVLRRRLPLITCVLIAGALALQTAISGVDFNSAGTALAAVVALYSAGAYLETRRAAVGVGVLA